MLKSDVDVLRFGDFTIDCGERRLWQGGAPVALSGRYLDALILLVREHGRLVPKDRFMTQVWRGVPVTDEALTQCIRTLRRALGDDAARPHMIETVPKHGYRFIADVFEGATAPRPAPPGMVSAALAEGLRGTTGAVIAGAIGGIFYGGAAAAYGAQMGGTSVFVVLWCVTVAMAAIGGAGVAFGAAAARALISSRPLWCIAGAMAGGLTIGGLVKLLGVDAFILLLGRPPGDITGGAEGAALGAASGLALWLAQRWRMTARGAGLAAAAVGGVAGLMVAMAGGRLLGGSLALLANAMPGSRLRLDGLGAMMGEAGFGTISAAVTATLEGALFVACITVAMHASGREALCEPSRTRAR